VIATIGVVRTGKTSLEDTPIQAALNRAERGVIEIDAEYQEGLDGLEGFGFAWLITWLHSSGLPLDEPAQLTQEPFLLRGTGRKVGVFATRGPRRVNPIGLSLIQLIAIRSGAIEFAGVDVVDGTPVIDLKPYVARFDRPPGEPPCGWFDEVVIVDGATPAALGRRHESTRQPSRRDP
jgi:tRNA (adenine37-N6)-methyltransferase